MERYEKKENRTKSKCPHCKKLYVNRKFIRHKCSVLCSQQTSTNTYNEDLQCTFCGLQTANTKLLEIHMVSCVNRNSPHSCKLCKSPIRLRSHDKQYCASCSTVKEGNAEYDLRCKVDTLAPSGSAQSCTVPVRNIENRNFQTVNCTDSRSSLKAEKSGRVTILDSQNKKKRKLNIHFAEQQVKKKKTDVTNLKITRAKEHITVKQIPTGMNQSKESNTTDKLSKNSGRYVVNQKKCLKRTNTEVSEKYKNNNLQKLKTPKQIDQKIRQTTKKNNSINKVTIQLLLDAIEENKCGMLLKSPSANKIEQYFKCCRCGKPIKNIKFGLSHFLNCKSNKLLRTEVSASDVIWICTFCESSFDTSRNLNEHLKRCNLLAKKYDSACGNRCEKCHFICLSSHSFKNHNCEEKLKNMTSCTVKLNTVKMNPTFGRAVMYECDFCGEIFDEQLTKQHFKSSHPGAHSLGNMKQYYVNLNPGSHSETVVVKTEPNDPAPYNIVNGSYSFQSPDHYPIVNNSPSFNPVLNNISMLPPPVPIVQSTVSLPIHQSSSALGETCSPSAINQQICKCVNHGIEKDAKPCLSCLSKLDVSKILQNSVIIPYELAKVKKETLEDSEASVCNTQADSGTAASFTPSAELVGADVCSPFQFPVAFQLNPSLTPPSSHNGISPPSTPLAQPLTNGDPCSASDASIGSLTEAISQLDEPRAEELVHYINDDRSPNQPLIRDDDDQEIFPPIDSSRLEHVWDIDISREIDAFAMVPFEGNEDVEKYVCAICVFVSFPNKNSIIRHLCQFHQDKPKYLVMYISENDELL